MPGLTAGNYAFNGNDIYLCTIYYWHKNEGYPQIALLIILVY